MRYLLAILFVCTGNCFAQVIPADNAVLNYRLAGFSVPEQESAKSYLFEISTDSLTNDADFKSHIIYKQNADLHRIIYTLPEWGKRYTWRVSYMDKKQNVISTTPLYHVTTGYNIFTDSNKYRLRIIANKAANKDMRIFIDGTKALYTLDGDPVWFLPELPEINMARTAVRDMHITPQHTISFLTTVNAYEISYDGKVLWTAPNDGKISGERTENYHHEFIRLANGNYMVAGFALEWMNLPNDVDSQAVAEDHLFKKSGDSLFKKIELGTLIEYDVKGNIVWSWRTSQHISSADVSVRKLMRGNLPDVRTHLNGFFFDEAHNVIYISYRDISRIIKIKYPSGDVIASYGENYVPGVHMQGSSFFRAQHAPRINADGNLILLNNNDGATPLPGKKVLSSIIILKEPVLAKDTLTKVWEFSCAIDSFASSLAGHGGNAIELKNGSILSCMGTVARTFIVNRNKAVIWNAIVEMRGNGKGWITPPLYRVSAIEDKKTLEQLIFNNP